MYIEKPLRITKGIPFVILKGFSIAPSPYFFIISTYICPVDMNVYARFDEIPSMTLIVIKKTKRNRRTDGRT